MPRGAARQNSDGQRNGNGQYPHPARPDLVQASPAYAIVLSVGPRMQAELIERAGGRPATGLRAVVWACAWPAAAIVVPASCMQHRLPSVLDEIEYIREMARRPYTETNQLPPAPKVRNAKTSVPERTGNGQYPPTGPFGVYRGPEVVDSFSAVSEPLGISDFNPALALVAEL